MRCVPPAFAAAAFTPILDQIKLPLISVFKVR
jgi:hypothetical protein